MRYYIRHDRQSIAEGPYTVAVLASGLRNRTIPLHSLASSDIGDSAYAVQRYRNADWFPLREIPELQIAPAPEPVVPRSHRTWQVIKLSITILCLAGAVALLLEGQVKRAGWMLVIGLYLSFRLSSSCERQRAGALPRES